MDSGHVHQSEALPSRLAVRVAAIVLASAGLLSVLAMMWLWPSDQTERPDQGKPPTVVTGNVTVVHKTPCPEQPGDADTPGPIGGRERECGTVKVTLTSGPDRGKEIETDIPSGPGAPTVRAGDAVKLIHVAPDSVGGGAAYQIQDHQRHLPLWLLGGLFAVAVIAFGRLRGLTALAGLTVTFAVLLLFIIPAILEGQSPLLVAIVGSAVIMLTVLYLTHGFSISTSVAVVGTLSSLVLTGVMAALATTATRLTGIASEETAYLNVVYGQVDMRGLLLAGILIGCLGVLDDVAVTQSVTVSELARANPGYHVGQLYEAATRVGRSHIASVVNTIVLAYAGASLPLLILITAGNQPIGQTLTNPLIAQEIVRAVVGTLGLIAAVPVTTLLAAIAAKHLPEPSDSGPDGDDDDGPDGGNFNGEDFDGAGPQPYDGPGQHADPAGQEPSKDTGDASTPAQPYPRVTARARVSWDR